MRIPSSPLLPGVSPVEIHVREAGAGAPLLLLHGGWGWEAYPWDLAALSSRRRIVAPDRVGYGGSSRIGELPRGFHALMAEETFRVMDALGLEEAAVWGHSDGSVIAAWMALLSPRRVRALVLEAFHFLAAKDSSVEFFRIGVVAPERFGETVVAALERDHGEDWRGVVAAGGRAWLSIIEEGRRGRRDLYDGRLGEVRAPALFLHGSRDPRTEPGELDAARAALPAARVALVDAGHCPHASARTGAECLRIVEAFLEAHDA